MDKINLATRWATRWRDIRSATTQETFIITEDATAWTVNGRTRSTEDATGDALGEVCNGVG